MRVDTYYFVAGNNNQSFESKFQDTINEMHVDLVKKFKFVKKWTDKNGLIHWICKD